MKSQVMIFVVIISMEAWVVANSLVMRSLDEVVKQHIPPLLSVTLDKCNVEVEKKFP